MVQSQSTARLFDLASQVILTQTDTTVGFLSQNAARLAAIKSRPANKPFIKVYTSLHVMKQDKKRIPNKFKRVVRRAKKTTFIVKNRAFRIAPHPLSSQVLRNLDWSYSTSANQSGHSYERGFCVYKTDIIIEGKEPLQEQRASSLYRLNNIRQKRLR